MGNKFIQAVTITFMLLLVMEIGSTSYTRYSSGSALQVIGDDPTTMFPALKAVFQ